MTQRSKRALPTYRVWLSNHPELWEHSSTFDSKDAAISYAERNFSANGGKFRWWLIEDRDPLSNRWRQWRSNDH